MVKRRRLEFSRSFGEEFVKVGDSLRDNIDHGNGKKESSTESHRKIHNSFVGEARESRDTVAKDGHFKKEDDHKCNFDSNDTDHYVNLKTQKGKLRYN